MTRLDSIAPKLSKVIEIQDKSVLKEMIFQACLFGLRNANIFNSYSKILDDYKYNTLDRNIRNNIENLIYEYDKEYFRLHDNSKIGSEKSLIPFNKARALSSLLQCFNSDDNILAAKEAIYEASVTSDNKDELFKLIFELAKN